MVHPYLHPRYRGNVVAGGADPGPHNIAKKTGVSYGGIVHIVNSGQCTWQEYAQHAIECCHRDGVPLKAKQVGAVKMSDMKNWVARRPVHSVLGTAKCEKLTGRPPRPWRDAVAEYV